MNQHAFDALARRTTAMAGRRAVVGLLAGALLSAMAPAGTKAEKDPHHGDDGGHHGGGGNQGKKKDKKEKHCGELARSCVKQVNNHCALNYPYNVDQANTCRTLYYECCGIYKKCKTNEGDQCIRDVNSLLLG